MALKEGISRNALQTHIYSKEMLEKRTFILIKLNDYLKSLQGTQDRVSFFY